MFSEYSWPKRLFILYIALPVINWLRRQLDIDSLEARVNEVERVCDNYENASHLDRDDLDDYCTRDDIDEKIESASSELDGKIDDLSGRLDDAEQGVSILEGMVNP